MRALILCLLFDGLGATEVTSAALAENASSNAVSKRTGYLPNGTELLNREGVSALHRRYSLTRARWDEIRPSLLDLLGSTPELIGVDRLREQLDAPS